MKGQRSEANQKRQRNRSHKFHLSFWSVAAPLSYKSGNRTEKHAPMPGEDSTPSIPLWFWVMMV